MQRLWGEMKHALTTISAMLQEWNRVPGPWLWLVALVVPLGWLAPVCRMAWVRVHRPPRS